MSGPVHTGDGVTCPACGDQHTAWALAGGWSPDTVLVVRCPDEGTSWIVAVGGWLVPRRRDAERPAAPTAPELESRRTRARWRRARGLIARARAGWSL